MEQDTIARLRAQIQSSNPATAVQLPQYEQVMSAAMKLLDRKRYTVFELSKKLKDKDIGNAKLRGAVVRRLQEIQLLDDRDYAESWIRTRSRINPRGAYVLQQELSKKGVDKQVIELAIRNVGLDEVSLATQIAQKKLSSVSHLLPEKQYQRILSLLQRRGFSYGVAKTVWKQLTSSDTSF